MRPPEASRTTTKFLFYVIFSSIACAFRLCGGQSSKPFRPRCCRFPESECKGIGFLRTMQMFCAFFLKFIDRIDTYQRKPIFLRLFLWFFRKTVAYGQKSVSAQSIAPSLGASLSIYTVAQVAHLT